MNLPTIENFDSWLDEILEKDLPDNIVAVSFNLYTEADDIYGWAIEFVGTDRYDKDDEYGGWACYEAYSDRDNMLYWKLPNHRMGADDMWQTILQDATERILNYLSNGRNASKLKEYAAVGVGFVDGDLDVIYKKAVG